MMGRSHVLTGWCAGAVLAQGIGLPASAAIGFGVITAGAAGLNDLDHDEAAASRALGPFSRGVAEIVQFLSRRAYAATRGPGDETKRGEHRYATHSLVMLIPIAVLVWLLPWLAYLVTWVFVRIADPGNGETLLHWSAPAMVGLVVGFCVAIVADRFGGYVLIAAGVLAAVLVVGRDVDTALIDVWPWLTVAIFVGTVVHVFGDLITQYGVPLLAPLYRRGPAGQEQRWVRVQLPSPLAFRAGGWFENTIVYPLLVVAAVVCVPGLWPRIEQVWRAVGAM